MTLHTRDTGIRTGRMGVNGSAALLAVDSHRVQRFIIVLSIVANLDVGFAARPLLSGLVMVDV